MFWWNNQKINYVSVIINAVIISKVGWMIIDWGCLFKKKCCRKPFCWNVIWAETWMKWRSKQPTWIFCSKSFQVEKTLDTSVFEWECAWFVWGKLKKTNLDGAKWTMGRNFGNKITELGWSCQSAAAASKSLQSCLTLCDPIDGSPPGSPIPGILQARTLEWVAISFSNAWKWKVKGKLLSRVRLLTTPWTA